MPALPHPLLVADIGGTNCRVAIVDAPGDAPRVIKRLSTKGEPSCEAALAGALGEAGVRPRAAVLAVAGPVIGFGAELTNAGWSFDGPSLIAALGVGQGLLLNDFEALATCLPVLGAGDLTPVCAGRPADGARLILGPGTGFGAAALVGREGRYTILPTEAGHMELGPVTADEFALWPLIELMDGRVTVESVLSGAGLARLDTALRAQAGDEAACADGALVSVRAEAGDAIALAAVRLFGRLLARVAGDLALAYKATGGVFIAGGIAPKLLPLFDQVEMRTAFSHKPPMDALMRDLPLWIVTGSDPAERGLAKVALDPAAFGLDNRLWA
jgi:glucokinase